MWKCKHCQKFFEFQRSEKANHSRWCLNNPKRNSYIKDSQEKIEKMNGARIKSGNLNQYVKGIKDGIPPTMSEDVKEKIRMSNLGKRHSEESKKKISEKALASSHRRLKKNVIKYITKDNQEIMLDSTWEFYLATKLDEMGIEWERPDPVKWEDKSGKIRHYFPDFYLPKLNLYIDPKNPAAYNSQQEKIECLLTQMENLVILRSVVEIDNFLAGVSPQSSKLMKG